MKIDFKPPTGGWRHKPGQVPGLTHPHRIYQKGGLLVLCSNEDGLWHLSITAKKRNPAYPEIKDARYNLVPDNVHMAMIFPPEAEFVNVHKGCFHLFQLAVSEVKNG